MTRNDFNRITVTMNTELNEYKFTKFNITLNYELRAETLLRLIMFIMLRMSLAKMFVITVIFLSDFTKLNFKK